PIEFFGLCGPEGHGHALSQGARGDPYPGKALMGGGMALKPGIYQPEGAELLDGEIAFSGQDAVEDRGDMAVGQEEEVLALAVHVETLLEFHDFIVQGHKKLGTSQGTARMP